MSLYTLIHYKKLGYAKVNELPTLPDICLNQSDSTLILSFRAPPKGIKHSTIQKVHGCMRIHHLPQENDVLCYGIETDSPLAPQLLWDIAHGLQVGRSLTLMGDGGMPSFLEREYYQGSLIIESRDKNTLVLRKKTKLPAEENAGLDEWTFGIPVGPEDATLLNAVVKRILELNISKKEILLCGTPGSNFHYLDQVRIVGEDIPAPPVRICTKKNRLVDEAKYDNVCILHDRVFLPSTFIDAIQKFGDFYPLMAFQSLYFDDKFNLIPRRYSDFNMAPNHQTQNTVGFCRDEPMRIAKITSSTFVQVEESGFRYANALRCTPNNYLTGSLYIVKKNVWKKCPQDNNIFWNEFEDVEHGLRAYRQGVVSRVNPYAISQSMLTRTLISFAGAVSVETISGTFTWYRSFLERLSLPRKPLNKINKENGLSALRDILIKNNTYADYKITEASVQKQNDRLHTIVQLIHASRIPIQRKLFLEFINTYEKKILCDQTTYSWKNQQIKEIQNSGATIRKNFLNGNIDLVNQVSQRPNDAIFANDLQDYFVQNSWLLKVGSFISALNLSLNKNRSIYLSGGIKTYYRAIINSTPFTDYIKDNKQ